MHKSRRIVRMNSRLFFQSAVLLHKCYWGRANTFSDLQLKSKNVEVLVAKSVEIRDTKTLNLSRNIVSLQVLVDVSRFSPCVINLSGNKNICCGLKKVVAKSRVWVYFEQQILALLLVFHQTHNLARNKCVRALTNQPIRALHFFNPQQMFLLRIKLIMQGEKRETSTKTCNETMLRDKLRVFYLVFRRLNVAFCGVHNCDVIFTVV